MFEYAQSKKKENSKNIVQNKNLHKQSAQYNQTRVSNATKMQFGNSSGCLSDDVRIHYTDKPIQFQAMERKLHPAVISPDEIYMAKTYDIDASSGVIQLMKTLNIASGTDISKLLPSNTEDEVINSDRGDMIYLRSVIKHFDRFSPYIEPYMDKLEFDGFVINDKIPQLVNKWFYTILGGEMVHLWTIITEIDKDNSLIDIIQSEQNLYIEDPITPKIFKFGTVLEESGENIYDKIIMTSGFQVPIFTNEKYTLKLYQILKPDGKLIITGNRPCLKTNGIIIDKPGSTVTSNFTPFALETVTKHNPLDSQHTITADLVTGEFFTVTFRKCS